MKEKKSERTMTYTNSAAKIRTSLLKIPGVLEILDHLVEDFKSSISMGKRKNKNGIVFIEGDRDLVVEVAVILAYGMQIRPIAMKMEEEICRMMQMYRLDKTIRVRVIVESVREME